MPKTEAPLVTWRDWQPAEREREPRRTCSVAGCKGVPRRVKETRTDNGKLRRHVYCQSHADELESSG